MVPSTGSPVVVPGFDWDYIEKPYSLKQWDVTHGIIALMSTLGSCLFKMCMSNVIDSKKAQQI